MSLPWHGTHWRLPSASRSSTNSERHVRTPLTPPSGVGAQKKTMGPNGSTPRLELFGGPRVTTARGLLRLSPYQELLLTLVWGQEATGLTRRRAIGLLWEEADDRRARQRLRQLLFELRVRLGCDVVDTGAEDVLRARHTAATSDLEEFRRALDAGDVRHALSVQRQEFGGTLRRLPGEAFEDWLEAKRGRLRRELREAAAARWDRAQPAGDWSAARDAAEVLYALDPANEKVVRMTIEARAMTGGVEAAEAAYAAFLEALEEGERPSREVLRLVERVRRLSEAVTAPQATGQARQEERLPLIGREIELGAAREALDRVRAGTFEFVLLKGDAGVGKTRLLEEVAKEAHLKGFRCLWASPVELEQRIPLNPLVDALGGPEVKRQVQTLDNPWKAVLSAVLPHRDPDDEPILVPPVKESSLSRRLYEAFSILFSRMAAEEPTLLILDDIHWADATTIAVLQFTQRRWRSGPFGVIAAIRHRPMRCADDVSRYLDPGGDLAVTPIEVRDLDLPGAQRLVTAVAGRSLSDDALRHLTELGGCNPFYLIELTRDYVAGRLRLPDTPGDGVTIPISLQQLVDARMQHLSDDAMRTASVLATWGSAVPFADLTAVMDMGVDRCVEVVEELARWELVHQDRNGVHFVHALFRSAIYAQLSEARKVVLHRLVAERLLTRHPSPHDELAIHFAHAADAKRAVQFGRLAATAAMENGALAEAAYFFQVVVDNETDPKERAEATADLAGLLHMKREMARANPLLELAATRLRAVGRGRRALRMDIRRVEGLVEVGATPLSELLGRLETIKAASKEAGDWEALALALDAELKLLHRGGMVEEIRGLFAEMRDCATKPDPAAVSVANASLAMNVLFGDCDEGLRCAERALEMARASGDSEVTLRALHRLVVVHTFRGSLLLPSAATILEEANRAAESCGDLEFRFGLAGNQGVFLIDAGELDRAEVALDRAADLIAGADAGFMRCCHLCDRGELALERGLFDVARAYYEEAEALLRPGFPPWVAMTTSAAIGLAALESGAIMEAHRREALLPPDPSAWYFDPNRILLFRARLLERRRQPAAALELLRDQADVLAHRLPLTFLRTEILACRITHRARLAHDQHAFARALDLAQSLNLTARVRDLELAW
jgi:DNA-binding SARP family transcriptional activator/tetratricopeptide (TPR) repeat protein